jgi:hypothetical protein
MALTLSAQDEQILRTAAYGAVSLMAAAGATGKPHRAATHGSIALASATGGVGHVLAAKSRIGGLDGRSVAEMADRVLPALTQSMSLLKKQDAAEADGFRSAVVTAVEAASLAHKGAPVPVLADMSRKITAALDAA